MEANYTAASKNQFNLSRGLGTFRDCDREKFKHLILCGQINIQGLNSRHIIEMEHRTHAIVEFAFHLNAVVTFPHKTIEEYKKSAFSLLKGHVPRARQGVLNHRRHDGKVLGVPGTQLEGFIGHAIPLPSIRDPLDPGAAGGQLFHKPLVTPVEVIDPVDQSFPGCREAGQNERDRSAQVCRHDWCTL